MSDAILSINKRLQQLETEMEIAGRKRHDEAQKAYKALSSISLEDADLLSGVVPKLAIAINFTAEDIEENKNGELQTISSICSELSDFLEQRLSFYEEQL